MSKQQYAGANWIKSQSYGKNISPLGEVVANLLGDAWAGIYHLDNRLLAKTDWADTYYIRVQINDGIATFDGPLLTWLVVLAHDRLLRLQISAVCNGRLALEFHQRKSRTGGLGERMPTIEDHIDSIRKFHPAPVEAEAVAHG